MNQNSQSLVLSSIPWDELKTHLADVITSTLTTLRDTESKERLMSVEETRVLLGGQNPLSKTTLAKWTKDGLLVQYRIGGRIYYKNSEILAALKTNRRYRRAGL